MGSRATAKNVRVSARKARFVIDMIRGKKADVAMAQLSILKNRAAQPVMKVLQSALANADQADPDADVDEYRIVTAYVDEGRTSGGRHPVSPWGKPTKGMKTRHRKGADKLIVKKR